MKAIICDRCGKLVPIADNLEIANVSLHCGDPVEKIIERDLCEKCLNKVVETFSENGQEMQNAVHVMEKLIDTLRIDQDAQDAQDANNIAPDANNIAPDAIPENKTPVPGTNTKQADKSKTDNAHEPVLCAYCRKPFVPKSKLAKCCSHYCANHKWIDEKKAKNPKKEKPVVVKARPLPTLPTLPTLPKKLKKKLEKKLKSMPEKRTRKKENSDLNNPQDILEEILNPEIDKKRKSAIAKSPAIRNGGLQEVPGMPRTWVQFKEGFEGGAMENFVDRVGKAAVEPRKGGKTKDVVILDEVE